MCEPEGCASRESIVQSGLTHFEGYEEEKQHINSAVRGLCYLFPYIVSYLKVMMKVLASTIVSLVLAGSASGLTIGARDDVSPSYTSSKADSLSSSSLIANEA